MEPMKYAAFPDLSEVPDKVVANLMHAAICRSMHKMTAIADGQLQKIIIRNLVLEIFRFMKAKHGIKSYSKIEINRLITNKEPHDILFAFYVWIAFSRSRRFNHHTYSFKIRHDGERILVIHAYYDANFLPVPKP